MTRFEEYCERKRAEYGDRFVAPTGEQFINAFNRGQAYRIKVRTDYGDGEVRERWGFVGITTGWQPAFLLMRSTRSVGSSDVLCATDRILDSHFRGR